MGFRFCSWLFQEQKKPEEKKEEDANKPEEAMKPEKKKEAVPKADEMPKEEANKGEEESKDPPPPAPQEVILRVHMHCESCAGKVRGCLKGFDGMFSFFIEQIF